MSIEPVFSAWVEGINKNATESIKARTDAPASFVAKANLDIRYMFTS
jgi:hypothetical protein